MRQKPVKILLIEDNPDEAYYVQAILLEGGKGQFELMHVTSLKEALEQLEKKHWDAALTDLTLPDSHGLETFDRVHALAPALPLVVLTGSTDEGLAVKAIQAGAQDYMLKGQLTAPLLTRTIHHAIERGRLVRELQEALATVKTLGGLLPICGRCKRIRDDQGYWNQIETFISKHTSVSFSHGLCPACAVKQLEESGLPVPEHIRTAAGQKGEN